MLEGLWERQLSFDENNFMKNAHTAFYNISLGVYVPNTTFEQTSFSWELTYYFLLQPLQKCCYVLFDKKLGTNEKETKL